MNKYSLNYEVSKKVFERCDIHIKECYSNVFKVVSTHKSNFRSGKWKVAYGYMTVFDNLLCRHCFIIDENENVIDPTIFAAPMINDDREYFVMKLYENLMEYFDTIIRNDYYPDLYRELIAEQNTATEWANKNNYILTG